MIKKNCLFITSVFSLFQVELAEQINRIGSFRFHVVFHMGYSQTRGRHWRTESFDTSVIHLPPKSSLSNREKRIWLETKIREVNPDVIIITEYMNLVYDLISDDTMRKEYIWGYWSEPPNPLRPFYIRLVRYLVLRHRIKRFRFVLAIGDRSEQFFKKILTESQNLHLVPYGQNLSRHLQIKRVMPEIAHFLFSGQLIKRQNIRLIIKCLMSLYRKYPNRFYFTFAGYGPEERIIKLALDRHPKLQSTILFDREYCHWKDRIRPFGYSNIFVYPSVHSGWGLVIPEAMASGLCVITTRNVEAARYFIRHRINGIFIEPTFKSLYEEMEWCINNMELVYEIGRRARSDCLDGHSERVAERFVRAMSNYL